MKTIILISSIFYLLGIQVGKHLDNQKKEETTIHKVITVHKSSAVPGAQSGYIVNVKENCKSDSVQKGSSYTDALLKPLEF